MDKALQQVSSKDLTVQAENHAADALRDQLYDFARGKDTAQQIITNPSGSQAVELSKEAASMFISNSMRGAESAQRKLVEVLDKIKLPGAEQLPFTERARLAALQLKLHERDDAEHTLDVALTKAPNQRDGRLKTLYQAAAIMDANLTFTRTIDETFKASQAELDRDRNKWVSKEELSAALKEPLDSAKHTFYQFLYDNYEQLESMSNDEMFAENDGITHQDILAYKKSRRDNAL